ncbi:helix-turn-helix transcriptional regulator [archaeon]|jgi:predicted transcriptional regulator|nr:helix-turn-helix transcriptional regulator [archaeon]
MKDEKFMLISMEDVRAKRLAEVIGNKTCKKIIDYLADNGEASVKDVSDALSIPINTAEYNVKKLLGAELIQKRKNFFWSKKGKKIVMYELSNKSIVIAPRGADISSKLKALIPVFIVAGVGTFASYVWGAIRQGGRELAVKSSEMVYDSAPVMAEFVQAGSETITTSTWSLAGNHWWFLGGALLVTLIFSVLNWRKL